MSEYERRKLIRQHTMDDPNCSACADGWPQRCPHGKLRHLHPDVTPPLSVSDCLKCLDEKEHKEQRALVRRLFRWRFPWLGRFPRS